jgi:hypothetical protein
MLAVYTGLRTLKPRMRLQNVLVHRLDLVRGKDLDFFLPEGAANFALVNVEVEVRAAHGVAG